MSTENKFNLSLELTKDEAVDLSSGLILLGNEIAMKVKGLSNRSGVNTNYIKGFEEQLSRVTKLREIVDVVVRQALNS